MIEQTMAPMSDEELDARVRQALHAGLGRREPSPEVWRRIRARIEDPEQDKVLRPLWVPLWNGLASLLQSAVLVALLLVFFMGNYSGLLARSANTRATAGTSVRAAARYPDDTLTTFRVLRMIPFTEPVERGMFQ